MSIEASDEAEGPQLTRPTHLPLPRLFDDLSVFSAQDATRPGPLTGRRVLVVGINDAPEPTGTAQAQAVEPPLPDTDPPDPRAPVAALADRPTLPMTGLARPNRCLVGGLGWREPASRRTPDCSRTATLAEGVDRSAITRRCWEATLL